MKILFFIESFTVGGKERRLSQLMHGIRSNPDIEYSLAIMSEEMHYKEVLELKIDIHYLIRKTKKDISVFYKFYKLCKKYRPDIVHCWDSMTAVYLVPACKLLGIKIVNGMVVDSTVQQNIFNKYWLRARLTFPFSDIVIGNSNAGLAAYNAPKGRSICIYNGMSLSRFENLTDPAIVRKNIFGDTTASFLVVGMVASFEERKDYFTLVKSAVSVVTQNEHARFVMVGDGPDLDRVKENVPATLAERIIFLGRRTDVESIINIFDIGVLLTNSKIHGEGISNSIIEYMALSKPVVATRGGGTDEVVFDDRNGFLVDPYNDYQLTERINELLGNQLLRNRLGDEGRKMVKERFDLEIMTKNYVELYKKMISL